MTGCRCIDGSYFYCFCRKGHPEYEKFLCLFPTAVVTDIFLEPVWIMLARVLLFIAPQVLIKSDN